MAIIVAGHGTVVLQEDGAVVVTDRARISYCLDAAIVAAIVELVTHGRDDVSA